MATLLLGWVDCVESVPASLQGKVHCLSPPACLPEKEGTQAAVQQAALVEKWFKKPSLTASQLIVLSSRDTCWCMCHLDHRAGGSQSSSEQIHRQTPSVHRALGVLLSTVNFDSRAVQHSWCDSTEGCC